MNERRRFYRIDDSVILNYQAFPDYQVDEAISRLKMLGTQHQKLQSSLSKLEERLVFLFNEISEPLPEIAEALKLINRKVNLIGSIQQNSGELSIKGDNSSTYAPTHEVNLSGSGLAFYSPTKFSIGETMEIEFVLFPSYYNVKAIGRVVNSREDPGDEVESRYQIAVDFVFLREEDREQIIYHVLTKQGRELKAQRELDKSVKLFDINSVN